MLTTSSNLRSVAGVNGFIQILHCGVVSSVLDGFKKALERIDEHLGENWWQWMRNDEERSIQWQRKEDNSISNTSSGNYQSVTSCCTELLIENLVAMIWLYLSQYSINTELNSLDGVLREGRDELETPHRREIGPVSVMRSWTPIHLFLSAPRLWLMKFHLEAYLNLIFLPPKDRNKFLQATVGAVIIKIRGHRSCKHSGLKGSLQFSQIANWCPPPINRRLWDIYTNVVRTAIAL